MASRTAKTISEVMQRRANDLVWQAPVRVRAYATRQLRPPEVVILVRYRELLSGRVLELGPGAGRLTGYLAEIAAAVHGIDVSAAMVEHARRSYPKATFAQGDLRRLGGLGTGGWEAVVAGYNVMDVLDDADRCDVLTEFHRLLAPGGTLVMSSHNRDVADRLGASAQLRGRPVRQALQMLLRIPIWYRNRRWLSRFERDEPGYAIRNDVAHDFGVLHYYVTRDAQEAQLRSHGFELLACLDADGYELPRGRHSGSHELHYVARRSD